MLKRCSLCALLLCGWLIGFNQASSEDVAEPPPVVDLCAWQTPIGNQGGRGACTYYPPIAALESAYQRRGHAVKLSVEHLIWLRNVTAFNPSIKDPDVNENNLAFLTGGGLSVNFHLLQRYGVCRDENMPYLHDHEDYNQKKHYGGFDVTDYRWYEPFRQVSLNRFNLDPKHLPNAARHDADYGIKEYVFLHGQDCRDPRKIEAILASGHEVAINLFIGYKPKPNDPDRARWPGVIWYRAKDAQQIPGDSHAMLLVGYDRPRQFFIVKNSWGPTGGKAFDVGQLPEGWKDLTRFKGFTLIHYNYLAGNREAAYIKSVWEPKNPRFLLQRAMGLWEIQFLQKSNKQLIGKAVLAWRRLPDPEAKRPDHRIGDWYGIGCKEGRVNAEFGPSDKISLYVDFKHPQLKGHELRGIKLTGKLALPSQEAGLIDEGTISRQDGSQELFGVPISELTFTAKQNLKENLLVGVDPNPNLVVNGSFEEGPAVGAYRSLKAGDNTLPGWRVLGEQIDVVETHWQSAEGKRSIDLHGSPGYGGVAQTFKSTPGSRYRVTFKMAGTPIAFGSVGGYKRMLVRAAGTQAEFSFDTTGKTPKQMGWMPITWEFVANAKETTLEFVTADKHDPCCGPALDEVKVIELAPRPE